MSRTVAVLAGTMLAALAWMPSTASYARQPRGQHIAGTVAKIDGNAMEVKAKSGAMLKIVLADNVKVTGVEKASMADIKPGSYIGSGAIPQPDGTQRAVEVHIFSPTQRGLGEGHRSWGGAKHGTMTNGTVGETVTKVGAERLTAKYKGGEQTIMVPPGTPIVRFVPGKRGELKAGAHISIFRAKKNADGSFVASHVSVGRGGVVPRSRDGLCETGLSTPSCPRHARA